MGSTPSDLIGSSRGFRFPEVHVSELYGEISGCGQWQPLHNAISLGVARVKRKEGRRSSWTPPTFKEDSVIQFYHEGKYCRGREVEKNSSRHDKNLSRRITAEVADVTLSESNFDAMRQNEREINVDPHVRAVGTVGADGEPKVRILSTVGPAPDLEESGLPPPVFHGKDGLQLQNVARTPKSAEEEAVAEGQVPPPATNHKIGDEEDVYVGAESKVASPGSSGSSGSQD